MYEVFVGRQPIYNKALDVVAYELLFRSGSENRADVINCDEATGQVLLNALVEIGLDQLVGDRLAFVNVTRRFITDEGLLPLDKTRIVLEILEGIEPDEEFLSALRRVALAGYRIALDDFTYTEKLRGLVQLADTVKLDVRALDRRQLQEHVQLLRRHGVKQLLAEKVETLDEFECCKRLGFDMFQGYFLSRPLIVGSKTLPNSRIAILQLLCKLQEPEVGVEQLETIVSRDVTLSFKLLQCVNSSAMGVRKKIESIRQAIALLGLERLRMMVTLITLTNLISKPQAVMNTALVRAKMCELLGRALKRDDSSSFYLVGLFSMLDVLLSQPLEAVLHRLHLSDDVKEAILNSEGAMGEVLRCVLAVERVEWDGASCLGLTQIQIQQAYLQAIAAADKCQAAVEERHKPRESGAEQHAPSPAQAPKRSDGLRLNTATGRR